MFSYRVLLRQAWKISRDHKYLWFFGLFASLLSAGSGWGLLTQNLEANYQGDFWSGVSAIFNWQYFSQTFHQGFINLFQSNWLFILDNILMLALIALIFIVVIWLTIASQGGLISHIRKIIDHKKNGAPELSVKDGLRTGHHNFWPIFGLNLGFKILMNFAFFLLTIPFLFIALVDSGWLGGTYVILFLIFIPIAIILNLIVKYAMAYTVIENDSFFGAIENAWRLFKRNWLISLEMMIALFAVNFLGGLILLLFLTIFILPLFIVGVVFGLVWLSTIMLILAIIAIAFGGSFLTTFENAGWVGLFIRLEEKGGVAKLERIFHKTKSKK